MGFLICIFVLLNVVVVKGFPKSDTLLPNSARNIHEYMTRDELLFIFGTSDFKNVPDYDLAIPILSPLRAKRQLESGEVINIEDTASSVLHLVSPRHDFTIHLRKSRAIISSDINVLLKGKSMSLKEVLNEKQDCLYNGIVSSHEGSTASFSMCDENTIRGLIITPEKRYIVHSVPHHLRQKRQFDNWGTGDRIIIYDDSDSDSKIMDFCGVENLPYVATNHDIVKRQTPSPHIRKIETAIFVDDELYKWAGQQGETNSMKATTNLIMALMTAVQAEYDNPSLEVRYKFIIVRLEVMENTAEGPDKAGGNINSYLNNFCTWQSEKNETAVKKGERPWDHAIMLTGVDLYSESPHDTKVKGMSWTSGMCRGTLSCSIVEGTTFKAVYIISHEIGHNLGMNHDGDNNDCPADKYIMSPSLGPGRMNWSSCSNDKNLEYLALPFSQCLDNDAEPEPNFDISQYPLPGQIFTVDQQCSVIYGNTYRPFIPLGSHSENICTELHCANGTHMKIAHPALEGTTCGERKICRYGDCISEPIISTTTATPMTTIPITLMTTEGTLASSTKVESVTVSETTSWTATSVGTATVTRTPNVTLSKSTLTTPISETTMPITNAPTASSISITTGATTTRPSTVISTGSATTPSTSSTFTTLRPETTTLSTTATTTSSIGTTAVQTTRPSTVASTTFETTSSSMLTSPSPQTTTLSTKMITVSSVGTTPVKTSTPSTLSSLQSVAASSPALTKEIPEATTKEIILPISESTLVRNTKYDVTSSTFTRPETTLPPVKATTATSIGTTTVIQTTMPSTEVTTKSGATSTSTFTRSETTMLPTRATTASSIGTTTVVQTTMPPTEVTTNYGSTPASTLTRSETTLLPTRATTASSIGTTTVVQTTMPPTEVTTNYGSTPASTLTRSETTLLPTRATTASSIGTTTVLQTTMPPTEVTTIYGSTPASTFTRPDTTLLNTEAATPSSVGTTTVIQTTMPPTVVTTKSSAMSTFSRSETTLLPTNATTASSIGTTTVVQTTMPLTGVSTKSGVASTSTFTRPDTTLLNSEAVTPSNIERTTIMQTTGLTTVALTKSEVTSPATLTTSKPATTVLLNTISNASSFGTPTRGETERPSLITTTETEVPITTYNSAISSAATMKHTTNSATVMTAPLEITLTTASGTATTTISTSSSPYPATDKATSISSLSTQMTTTTPMATPTTLQPVCTCPPMNHQPPLPLPHSDVLSPTTPITVNAVTDSEVLTQTDPSSTQNDEIVDMLMKQVDERTKIKGNQDEDDDDMDSDGLDAMQDDDEAEVAIPLNIGQNVGSWIHQRSECSKSCGNGTRLITYHCLTVDDKPSNQCDPDLRPANMTEICNTQPCIPPRWYVQGWSECNVTSGQGIQTLLVACAVPLHLEPDGSFDFIADDNCNETKPEAVRVCYS